MICLTLNRPMLSSLYLDLVILFRFTTGNFVFHQTEHPVNVAFRHFINMYVYYFSAVVPHCVDLFILVTIWLFNDYNNFDNNFVVFFSVKIKIPDKCYPI